MRKNNVVFELEGLSDDADKAFCVGLLIIYINEYRQVAKETTSSNSELTHLLVIEEAHRLLKNISTERISEDIGNPKGKAVVATYVLKYGSMPFEMVTTFNGSKDK